MAPAQTSVPAIAAHAKAVASNVPGKTPTNLVGEPGTSPVFVSCVCVCAEFENVMCGLWTGLDPFDVLAMFPARCLTLFAKPISSR